MSHNGHFNALTLSPQIPHSTGQVPSVMRSKALIACILHRPVTEYPTCATHGVSKRQGVQEKAGEEKRRLITASRRPPEN